jgi:hypothetical protein
MSIFVPPTTTIDLPLPDMVIPYNTLYTFLNEAEIRQQVVREMLRHGP